MKKTFLLSALATIVISNTAIASKREEVAQLRLDTYSQEELAMEVHGMPYGDFLQGIVVREQFASIEGAQIIYTGGEMTITQVCESIQIGNWCVNLPATAAGIIAEELIAPTYENESNSGDAVQSTPPTLTPVEPGYPEFPIMPVLPVNPDPIQEPNIPGDVETPIGDIAVNPITEDMINDATEAAKDKLAKLQLSLGVSFRDLNGYKELGNVIGEHNSTVLIKMAVVNEMSWQELQRLALKNHGVELSDEEAKRIRDDLYKQHVKGFYNGLEEAVAQLSAADAVRVFSALSNLTISSKYDSFLAQLQANGHFTEASMTAEKKAEIAANFAQEMAKLQVSLGVSFRDVNGYKELGKLVGTDNVNAVIKMAIANEMSWKELQRLAKKNHGIELSDKEAQELRDSLYAKHVKSFYNDLEELISKLPADQALQALMKLNSFTISSKYDSFLQQLRANGHFKLTDEKKSEIVANVKAALEQKGDSIRDLESEEQYKALKDLFEKAGFEAEVQHNAKDGHLVIITKEGTVYTVLPKSSNQKNSGTLEEFKAEFKKNVKSKEGKDRRDNRRKSRSGDWKSKAKAKGYDGSRAKKRAKNRNK